MAYVTKSHLENFAEKLLANDKKIRDELKEEISKLPSGGGSGSSYKLPTASTTILGGVKVDNDTITVDSEGVISATQELPIGGTTGQMLVKKSGTNYDVEWKDVPQGGTDVDVATTDKAGIVKPDGTSITVDSDGTIHATTDTNQIKQDIEDYMTEHPVSADVGDKTVTEEKLSDDVLAAIKGKKILFADTVADIKDLPLYDGAVVKTLGFNKINDGGAATYKISKINNSLNMLKINNTFYKQDDIGLDTGNINTFENGDIVLNGNLTNVSTSCDLLLEELHLESGKTYTFSVTEVSGTCTNNGAGINFQLLGGINKSISIGTAKSNPKITFTTTSDYNTTFIKYGTANEAIFDKYIVHLQLEEGSEATPWVDADYNINGHTAIKINDEYAAVLVVENNMVSMTQLGYFPNELLQDCHDSINNYLYLCRKDSEKYTLFFPSGRWLFSETDVHNNRKGVKISGVSSQVGSSAGNQFREGESVIMPFSDNQRYIWNIGKSYGSKEIVGGNELRNLSFSTGYGLELGEKRFCEAGLLLTFCCYSDFDGLYFHTFRGSGLVFHMGWENKFGFLNFRGVGAATPEKTYSPVEFRQHPVYLDNGYASGVSANYFDYFNFEGFTGNCILFEQGSCAVHNEINDIQIEGAYFDAYIDGVTTTYNTDTKDFDDESEDIEHLYVIKGTAGAHYNPLIINNISLSTGAELTRTAIWEGDDGYKHRRYMRYSGIFGQLEKYPTNGKRHDGICNGKRYGLHIMVNNISSLPNGMPIFHSVDGITGGTKIQVNQHDGKAVPIKGKNMPLYLFRFLDWGNSSSEKDYATYFLEDIRNNDLEMTYVENTISEKRYAYSHGSASLPNVNGTKTIKLRMYVDYTLEDFPGNHVDVGLTAHTKEGKSLSVSYWLNKDLFVNGEYPLKEWFDFEIPRNLLPMSDFILSIGMHRNVRVYYECFKVYPGNKPLTSNEMHGKGLLYTSYGTLLTCRDRRVNDTAPNGVVSMFNGKEWVTLDGTKAIKSLTKSNFTITYNLTNCISSNSSVNADAETSYSTTITAQDGYALDSVTCDIDGSNYPVTDGNVAISRVSGDIVITASATVHHSITNNINNCASSNLSDFAIDGKSYTTYVYAEAGYTLDGNVTCTMGGVDQTVAMGTYKIDNKNVYAGKINITSVTDDVVITANVVENEHQAVSTTLTNCTIDYNKNYVLKGSKVIMTITADDGYVLEPVTAKNGTDTIEVIDGIATIWEVKGDIEIVAEASLIPPTI